MITAKLKGSNQKLNNILESVLAWFCLSIIVFIPFISDFQQQLSRILFGKIVTTIQRHVFRDDVEYLSFSSDTFSLNLLVFCLFLASIGISILMVLINRTKISKKWINTLSVYYLAFILLRYGLDKIFKVQFYLPEPNILYTEFGMLSKDILFWSTMGTSRFYSVAIGSIEVGTAILLLINRLRPLGLFLGFLIFTHIFLINVGFDISVKTFSLLLLIINSYAFLPYTKAFYHFWISQKSFMQTAALPCNGEFKIFKKITQITVAAILIGYLISPYLNNSNFNDDVQKRPLLHGAYEVERILENGVATKKSDFNYQRIFIHRQNFIIFQLPNRAMVDYHYTLNKLKKELELEDYQQHKFTIRYIYSAKDSTLKFVLNHGRTIVETKKLDWRKLPALKDQNHIFIEQIE